MSSPEKISPSVVDDDSPSPGRSRKRKHKRKRSSSRKRDRDKNDDEEGSSKRKKRRKHSKSPTSEENPPKKHKHTKRKKSPAEKDSHKHKHKKKHHHHDDKTKTMKKKDDFLTKPHYSKDLDGTSDEEDEPFEETGEAVEELVLPPQKHKKTVRHMDHVDESTASLKRNEEDEEDNDDDSLSAVSLDRILKMCPIGIYYIVWPEIAERYNYYGIKATLTLYLTEDLTFNKRNAKIVYHMFICMSYFFSVLLKFTVTQWLGTYNTIIFMCVCFMIGVMFLSITAMPYTAPEEAVTILFVGLMLLAFSGGALKPAITLFGADQFELPYQERGLSTFFSWLYFLMNFGSFLSTIFSPIIHMKPCFGQRTCYPISFGVSMPAMAIALVIFVAGTPWYKFRKKGVINICTVILCIGRGLHKKLFRRHRHVPNHWLDYSLDKYDRKTVEEIKQVIGTLLLLIPAPIFWALVDSVPGTWVILAGRMKTDLGFYSIHPDQMIMLAPLFIIILLPFTEYILYPALAKVNFLVTPFSRIMGGCICVIIAYGMVAVLAFILDAQDIKYALPTKGEAHFRIYNNNLEKFAVKCLALSSEDIVLEPFSYYERKGIYLNNDVQLFYTSTLNGKKDTGFFLLTEGRSSGYAFKIRKFTGFNDLMSKSKMAKLRILANFKHFVKIEMRNEKDPTLFHLSHSEAISSHDYYPGCYFLIVNGEETGRYCLRQGGFYVMLLYGNNKRPLKAEMKKLRPSNSISVLWMMPPYFFIALGEVLFAVTGLEMPYKQVPKSMKNVLQAFWGIMVALGNLLIVVVEQFLKFDNQCVMFTLYGILMLMDMCLFAGLAVYNNKLQEPDKEVERKRRRSRRSSLTITMSR